MVDLWIMKDYFEKLELIKKAIDIVISDILIVNEVEIINRVNDFYC